MYCHDRACLRCTVRFEEHNQDVEVNYELSNVLIDPSIFLT